MLQRVLEPEVMDSWQEATAYDAMDFTEVNSDFVRTAIALHPTAVKVLDIGTGPARIPILLCQAQSGCRVIAVDLAQSMLVLGRRNVEEAGLAQRIRLELADGKGLPYPNMDFDLVISNSLVHHVPEPIDLFKQVARLVTPRGAVLIRDLLRPESLVEIDRLVAAAGDFGPYQNQLLRDSLHAALTLDEVTELAKAAGLTQGRLYQSSERHWTLAIAAHSNGESQ
jgi:ubiquinone/menaquinone biosynthesis C-methylase UbiE